MTLTCIYGGKIRPAKHLESLVARNVVSHVPPQQHQTGPTTSGFLFDEALPFTRVRFEALRKTEG